MAPETPPLPLYSEVIAPGVSYRVVFDAPVLLPTHTLANWFIVKSVQDYGISKAAALGNTVQLSAVTQPSFTPPEGIDYHATPPNLTGLTGLPVAPFVRLPFGP